ATIAEVAWGITLRQQQGVVAARHLEAAAMERAASDLRNERELVIFCPCKRHNEQQQHGRPCDAEALAAHLEQLLDIERETDDGPPQDSV
ncbi:MAG: hypothetical protein SGPRY_005626, partial [Prymnesium sp.]